MPPKQHYEADDPVEQSEPRQELDDILNRVLTPGNIDDYADKALRDLIELTDRVSRLYRANHEGEAITKTTKETEDEAFKEYGLGDVTSALDHIIRISEAIHSLEAVINTADNSTSSLVIVPPDVLAARAIIEGDGTFESASTIPRLKAALFVLKNDFDIDFQDPQQFRITKGVLRSDMMRKESYYAILTPLLNRTTLICNEEGNVTFVFDSNELEGLSISQDDVVNMTKDEIKKLIEQNPNTGRKIVYHASSFIPNLTSALGSNTEQDGQYLHPKAPEDYMTIPTMADVYNVSTTTTYKALVQLRESGQLGEEVQYKGATRHAIYYSPSQQQKILEALKNSGVLSERPPEGYLSAKGIEVTYGISQSSTQKILEMLSAQLGTVGVYKFNSGPTKAYSPAQQQLVKEVWDQKEEKPEGSLTLKEFADSIGYNVSSLYYLLKSSEKEIGQPESYKQIFNRSVIILTPTQQNKVRQILTERG